MDKNNRATIDGFPSSFDVQAQNDTQRHKTSSVQINDEEDFAGSMSSEPMDIDKAMKSIGGLNDDDRPHEVFPSEETAERTGRDGI